MKSKVPTLTFTLAAAVLLLQAPVAQAAGGANVSITMNSMTVDTTTAGQAMVTVNITNNSGAQVKVDLNVIALGDCQGDTLTCDVYDCTRSGVGGVDGVNFDTGASGDFSVMLPLHAGDHIFRSRITGTKGGSGDQKWGVQSATVL